MITGNHVAGGKVWPGTLLNGKRVITNVSMASMEYGLMLTAGSDFVTDLQWPETCIVYARISPPSLSGNDWRARTGSGCSHGTNLQKPKGP